MNFPNNYNNNNIINLNYNANMNERPSGASDMNSFPDQQNDNTMKIDDVANSKDGNSIDIKNFMYDMMNNNSIRAISTTNDFGIIGEVYFSSGLKFLN